MKIIKNYPATLDLRQTYNLTRNPDSRPMKNLEGASFNCEAFALYTDVNSKGEEQEILSILTNEGDTFSTISSTFKRDFSAIVDMCADFNTDLSSVEIAVVGGESKAGRHYIGCKMN